MGFNLNLAKRRAAQKLLEKYPVFLEEIPLTANGLPPIAELAQKVLLKFQTVKAEAGHCIVRCELDSRNVFTGESWNVKIARQKCALNVLENYPLLKKDMPKVGLLELPECNAYTLVTQHCGNGKATYLLNR